MRHKKNITLNLQNITSHFTEKKKIITLSFRNITLVSLIIMLSFVNIINASALNYQGSAEIKFTFNPTLSINISPSDLMIDNLTPGTTSDSNIINVSVATNASHGYTLSATVGDSLHNNTNLTHANNTDIFSSIAMDANLANLTTDNTWGYSYRLSSNNNTSNSSDNSNTWSSYSGLSNETSKILISTDNQLAKPIDFKIAAKASNAQPSGTYTNAINFVAISKPIPKTIEDIVYMQTFGELLPTDLQSVKDSMILNQDYILKDSRDEKEYYVTRLEDGNVWMTQNLAIDLGHTDRAGNIKMRTFTSENTDLNVIYDPDIAPDAYMEYGGDNYDVEDGIISWTPGPTAQTSAIYGVSAPDWANSGSVPYSAKKIDGPTAGHEALGNYYNWTAVIASNDSSSRTSSTLSNVVNNPRNSICPKGWRLPTISNQANNIPGSTNEFDRLNFLYNGGQTSGAGSGTKLAETPLWLIWSGYINGAALYNCGAHSYYLSSTVFNSGSTYGLNFNNDTVSPAALGNRSFGKSVRCLAR